MATEALLAFEIDATSVSANQSLVEVRKTPAQLSSIVEQFASARGWMGKVRLCEEKRWYERLYHGPDHDVWVLSWLPGQSTGFHDHGESAGAFIAVSGVLEEHRPGEHARVISPGTTRAFDADYAHDVRNASLAPAISIHAYSPPLSEMNEYDLDEDRLVPRQGEAGNKDAIEQESRMQTGKMMERNDALTIEQLLHAARTRLRRLSPDEAREAVLQTQAILVDIRPEAQRAIEGTIPGALMVERNVLEWRFDPHSSARLPVATDHSLQVIVFCSEGYTSSLAAAALQDLGLTRATDVVGGFHAWRAAGLPVALAGGYAS